MPRGPLAVRQQDDVSGDQGAPGSPPGRQSRSPPGPLTGRSMMQRPSGGQGHSPFRNEADDAARPRAGEQQRVATGGTRPPARAGECPSAALMRGRAASGRQLERPALGLYYKNNVFYIIFLNPLHTY